jgi:uncharacterized membrane protein YGL010W
LRLGVLMTVLMGLSCLGRACIGAAKHRVWLGSRHRHVCGGLGDSVCRPHYEGRKPAFVDDVTGLIVGPLFVVAELAFLLGLRHELKAADRSAGGGCAAESESRGIGL